jgi:nicotinamidase/pyrazinamidase
MPRTHLLVIDPQNDFCDLPASACPPGQTPALPVPGADADLHRVAELIRAGISRIQAITLTLDSHQRYDIAHPPFWRRSNGAAVPAFTAISAEQVRAGEFLPAQPQALTRVLAYLDALEAGGRYRHMVWPVHCEEGSWGHATHAGIAQACARWAHLHQSKVSQVFKGRNPWTEHYSAIQAEVPDAQDPATQPNRALLTELSGAQRILVAGQAASHCVRATVEHLLAHLKQPERLTLLTDGMSAVSGFEAHSAEFFQQMRAQGVQLMRCVEWLDSAQTRAQEHCDVE